MFQVATTIWDQELKSVKASKVWSKHSDEELFSGTLRGQMIFFTTVWVDGYTHLGKAWLGSL